MEISNFNELNALHKLLVTIKTSNNLMSYEIDLFAGSPFINEILKRVRQEFTTALRQQYGDEEIDRWLKETKFAMENDMGKAIRSRIQDWDTSTVSNLASKTRKDFEEIAKNYIEPIDYEAEELEKLVLFIARRLKVSL